MKGSAPASGVRGTPCRSFVAPPHNPRKVSESVENTEKSWTGLKTIVVVVGLLVLMGSNVVLGCMAWFCFVAFHLGKARQEHLSDKAAKDQAKLEDD